MGAKRPYQIRNTVSGRTLSFASSEAALNRLSLLAALPKWGQAQFVYIEDGITYEAPGMIATMRTIGRVYDIAHEYVAAHETSTERRSATTAKAMR